MRRFYNLSVIYLISTKILNTCSLTLIIMIMGVTGVFGSGKTTVADMFARCGYKIINADKIGHQVLNRKDIKDKVLGEFGKGVLTKNKIDRGKLKDVVFYNNKELIKLNKIIHPFIIKEIKSRIMDYGKNRHIVVDASLIIEAKALNLVDKLIVVKVSGEEQLKRALSKKKYTKEEIDNIINSQLSQREKLKYADIIIDNSKDKAYTRKQVLEILK